MSGDLSNTVGNLSQSLQRLLDVSLSTAQVDRWAGNLHAPPWQWMEWTAQALREGHWGRERAVGMLRLFFAALAQGISPRCCHRGRPPALQRCCAA